METKNKENQKNHNIAKILAIIGGIFVVIVIMVIVALSIIKVSSNKILCKSDGKSLTVYYNNETIVGYSAKNINFNTNIAKNAINAVGIDNYISSLETWYELSASGKCKITKNK